MIHYARRGPLAHGCADVQGHFLRNLQKQTIYLFIYLFWQGVIIVPKQQKPHFTPKFINGETDGGWIELSLVSCEFLEFTWEKIVPAGCLETDLGQDLPQRKAEGYFFIWGMEGIFCFFFNKSHQDVVFHIFFDLAPGKPKLRLLGLPLRHIALYWNPNLLCSGPWPRSKATLLVN